MRDDVAPYDEVEAKPYPERIRVVPEENICRLIAPYNPGKWQKGGVRDRKTDDRLYEASEEAVRDIAREIYYTDGRDEQETTTILIELNEVTKKQNIGRFLFLCGREIASIHENKAGKVYPMRGCIDVIAGGFEASGLQLLVKPKTLIKMLVLRVAAEDLFENCPEIVADAWDLSDDTELMKAKIRGLEVRVEYLESPIATAHLIS